MRFPLALTAAATLLVFLTACSGPTTDFDAASIIKAIAEQGLPVTLTVTYTAETDPNKQLGRPNGYMSKAAFTDSRIDASKVTGGKKGDVKLGGSVEVFKDAEQRVAYIQEADKRTSMLSEYAYGVGPVLMRLSKELSPMQAAAFGAALSKVVQ